MFLASVLSPHSHLNIFAVTVQPKSLFPQKQTLAADKSGLWAMSCLSLTAHGETSIVKDEIVSLRVAVDDRRRG